MAARDRGRIVQRLEKFLESSGIKLSAVATDLTGVSARAMLEALVAGERDPKVLADLAKRTLRHKIPAVIDALQGRFTEHHAFMVSQYLAQLDTQQATIDALTGRIETVIAPFAETRDALVTIPGISQTVADVIIAETGADMTVFPTAGHLASWAGVCPGLHESAGRVKSAHTRHGNAHLKAALGVAAMSASRTTNTYLAARYRRIATRRGPVRAVVAIERTILTAVWTCSPTTRHTSNSAATTTPGATRCAPSTRRSGNSKRSAIRSPSNPPSHDRTRTLVIVRTALR
jgi:transposase